MIDLLPLAIAAVVVGMTLVYASWQDLRNRLVLVVTWYPAAVIAGIAALFFWYGTLQSPTSMTILMLVLALLFAGMIAALGALGMFGMADAKAIILISLTVPVTPFASWIFPSLAVSSVVNGCVIALVIPVGFLLYNTAKRNTAPFWLRCSGFPVPGDRITSYFGFIAEKLSIEDGKVMREFTKARSGLRSLSQTPELLIRNLREEPEKYAEQIELCRKAGTVWISYGVPFLVPLTIGYFLALAGISLTDALLSLL